MLGLCQESVLILRDNDPQIRLHNQVQRTNGAPGLSLGTDLVSFLMCESKDKQETCAGKGESDATKHHNKDRGDRIDEVYTAHCLREHGGSR